MLNTKIYKHKEQAEDILQRYYNKALKYANLVEVDMQEALTFYKYEGYDSNKIHYTINISRETDTGALYVLDVHVYYYDFLQLIALYYDNYNDKPVYRFVKY